MSGHDFVFGETPLRRQGAVANIFSDYERMYQAPVVPHADVVEFVRDRPLDGAVLAGPNAHLLASALVERLKLWTTDPRLATLRLIPLDRACASTRRSCP